MRAVKRLCTACLLALAYCVAAEPQSEAYSIERIVAPSAFHGVHGLAFDANDRLFAGSVVGQSVYAVDRELGRVDVVVPPPEGMADDLVFLADGTMVWTSISVGMVRARKNTEPVRVIARDLPGINSINVRKSDGRLFAAQVFGGDGVWELDPKGAKPPRSIIKDVGGFNGFDIGADGMLYGPLWFKRQVVRIDPDSGALQVIAQGFGTPAAANFDSKGNLYVLDTARGDVVRVNIATGAKQVIARLATSIDNLAIDSADRIFVSNMADNAIHEVDATTGAVRQLIKGRLSTPRAIASATDRSGRDSIFVADVFAFRRVDGRTGAITDIARAHAANTPIAYANSVTANDRRVTLTNSNGVVQSYDRRTSKLLREWRDLRGAQTAIELPDGDILVAGAPQGTLMRLSGTKEERRKIIVNELRGSVALALAPSGEVYVSSSETGEIVLVELAHGTKHSVARDLKTPQGLTVGTDGNLFVIERDSRALTRIDVRTGSAEAVAANFPVGRHGVANSSAGVAAGARGTLYVVSDIENSIYRLTPRR